MGIGGVTCNINFEMTVQRNGAGIVLYRRRWGDFRVYTRARTHVTRYTRKAPGGADRGGATRRMTPGQVCRPPREPTSSFSFDCLRLESPWSDLDGVRGIRGPSRPRNGSERLYSIFGVFGGVTFEKAHVTRPEIRDRRIGVSDCGMTTVVITRAGSDAGVRPLVDINRARPHAQMISIAREETVAVGVIGRGEWVHMCNIRLQWWNVWMCTI